MFFSTPLASTRTSAPKPKARPESAGVSESQRKRNESETKAKRKRNESETKAKRKRNESEIKAIESERKANRKHRTFLVALTAEVQQNREPRHTHPLLGGSGGGQIEESAERHAHGEVRLRKHFHADGFHTVHSRIARVTRLFRLRNIQGTFAVIQGTFGLAQGTFGVLQGTFSAMAFTRSTAVPRAYPTSSA
jgi:hypothetical protein